ncbi:hypothetical protein PUN28_019312 [Cardiocondyla obscurior]|uniref:Uncharacterized protein n=1 Tax=Cardiocondyla obscurior TaxID=286306 RepID=A0AAW2EAY3_9HYME
MQLLNYYTLLCNHPIVLAAQHHYRFSIILIYYFDQFNCICNSRVRWNICCSKFTISKPGIDNNFSNFSYFHQCKC